jgi:hypothetical protein
LLESYETAWISQLKRSYGSLVERINKKDACPVCKALISFLSQLLMNPRSTPREA